MPSQTLKGPLEKEETSGPEPDPKPIEWFRENSIPIAGVLFVALAVSLLLHYGATTGDRTRAKDIADILSNCVQAIAIIAGGAWAIFTFSKGRQFQESLVLSVLGKVVVIDTKTYIIINTRIQNIGTSKIEFDPGSSTLRVNEYIKPSTPDVITVPDKPIGQFDPLDEKDVYIEPNEIIYGTRLIAIPNPPDVGFRLDFMVISAKKSYGTHEGYTWRTSCMVEKFTPSGKIGQAGGFPAEEA